MTGPRSRRIGVIAIAIALVLPLVQPQASHAVEQNAPQDFTDAVLTRLALMQHNGSPSLGPRTFPQLQGEVQALATCCGDNALPLYVDPETGWSWNIAMLLEEASGTSTWLGESATVAARKEQIEQVLGTMGWRLAALSGGKAELRKFVEGSQSQGCNGTNTPSASLVQKLQELTGQFPSATATVGGGSGMEAHARFFEVSQKAQVWMTRIIHEVDLPSEASPQRPVDGIAIDGARAIVTNFVTGGSGDGVGMGAISIAGLGPFEPGWQSTPSHWDEAGTSIGTTAAAPADGTPLTSKLDFPHGFLLADPDPADPIFHPIVGLRFKGQEPPAQWLAGLECFFGDAGNGASWISGTNFTSPAAPFCSCVRVLYHEAFPSLTAGPPMRVGRARLDYSDRLKRLAKQLRDGFKELSNEKGDIQALLPKLKERVEGIEDRIDKIEGSMGPIRREIDESKRFVKAVIGAIEDLPSGLRSKLQARESLEETIDRLKAAILQAKKNGDEARVAQLRKSLNRTENQLAEIDKALRGRTGNVDEAMDHYVKKMRKLQGDLFELSEKLIDARKDRSETDEKLKRKLGRQTELGAELLALQQRLLSLNFEVEKVSVDTGGSKIFEAEFKGPYDELEQVNADLAELEPLLDGLKQRREEAREDFLGAHRDARRALARVTEVIHSNALLKAGIDTIDYAYDVSKGFGQGGPIGALGAALKKGLEGLPGVLKDINSDWGATELTKFDQQYASDVTDGLARGSEKALDKVNDLAVSRVVKDTLGKPLKDAFNAGFLAFYTKIYDDVPDFYKRGGGAMPGSTTSGVVKKLVDRLKTYQKWSKTRGQALNKLWKRPKMGGLADITKGFIKDLTKAAAKSYLDSRERDAWEEYFEAELFAAGFRPLWLIAHRKYWEADDALQGLKAKKARLMRGYDPNDGTKKTLDLQFANGSFLTIALTVDGPTSGSPPDLEVRVGGRKATPTGGHAYTVSTSGLTVGDNGLGLVVTAR
jgi:uncharacterized coiled-coil DUF342 family protein